MNEGGRQGGGGGGSGGNGGGKQIKKKIRVGTIVGDFEGSALVVNYTTEVSMIEEGSRRVIHTATSAGQKRFPVRVTEYTDLPHLADELIEKSNSYINPSKRDQVMTVLNAMRLYSMGQEPPEQLRSTSSSTSSTGGGGGGGNGGGGGMNGVKSAQDILHQASLFQDMMYEEMETKIKGAEGLLEMAKIQSNLEVMAESGSLLEAISRVMREEASKNIDLATALIGIVFCFSNYKEFIPILATNRFGEACFVVIETELKRRDVLADDIRQKRFKANNSGNRNGKIELNCLMLMKQQLKRVDDVDGKLLKIIQEGAEEQCALMTCIQHSQPLPIE